MTCGTQQRLHDAAGPARYPGTDALIALAGLPGACLSMRADGLGQADLIAGRPSRLAEAATRAARRLVRSRSRPVRDGTQFACVPGGLIPRIRDAVQTAHRDRGPVPDRTFTGRHEHRAQIIAPLLPNRHALARVLADPGVTCVG